MSPACGPTGKGNGGCCPSSMASNLRRVLRVMLDENEFLSPYGIRALSRVSQRQSLCAAFGGGEYRVAYEPAESSTGLFGGNSNWRGPIWFPVNYLLIESLQKFHHYFGDDFKVECPTGSGSHMTLWEVAAELSRRLTRIFLQDEEDGGRCMADAAISTGSALAGSGAVLRILSWRRRIRRRRESSDRLDRPGREAAAAERRVIWRPHRTIRPRICSAASDEATAARMARDERTWAASPLPPSRD